jgi:uncharacterized protein YndB with AHSA1/START domain
MGDGQMYKVESSIVINAPVEEVYDWVQHPEKHHAWQHGLLESKRTEDGKVVVVRKFLGRRVETHFHERTHEPNKAIHRRGQNGPGMPIKYTVEQHTTFEPVDGGTKVTITSEVDSKGAFKAALPTIARVSKHEQDSSLHHLKELVEAHDDLHDILGQVPAHA